MNLLEQRSCCRIPRPTMTPDYHTYLIDDTKIHPSINTQYYYYYTINISTKLPWTCEIQSSIRSIASHCCCILISALASLFSLARPLSIAPWSLVLGLPSIEPWISSNYSASSHTSTPSWYSVYWPRVAATSTKHARICAPCSSTTAPMMLVLVLPPPNPPTLHQPLVLLHCY